jgi:hypothetical protein
MKQVELTVTELNAVLERQKGNIKQPFYIVRPIDRDDPLWRAINEDQTTKWRCDGLWSRKDGGNNEFYLERLNNQGAPTEKYERVGKCPCGKPGEFFRANFNTFEIKRVSVTRLHNAILRPTADDLSQWGEQWKKNPFVWKIAIKKVYG